MLAEHGESLATCTDVEPVDNGWSDAAEQSSAWSRFYDRHDTAPFFKARRYLTAEFPILMQTNGVTVLEVGCGTGSSVLPLLEANPGARVIACDFSASAVAAINRAIKKAGASTFRRKMMALSGTDAAHACRRSAVTLLLVRCRSVIARKAAAVRGCDS